GLEEPCEVRVSSTVLWRARAEMPLPIRPVLHQQGRGFGACHWAVITPITGNTRVVKARTANKMFAQWCVDV
ncbi:MAG: hypothetical protein ORN54_03125, partial [Cyclobacteriaceae bacterium]|nr:hypothetical protein [Cyclobacteriaceae bacterium]